MRSLLPFALLLLRLTAALPSPLPGGDDEDVIMADGNEPSDHSDSEDAESSGSDFSPEADKRKSLTESQFRIDACREDIYDHVNRYPSHGDEFMASNANNGMPYFDYSGAMDDWEIHEISRTEVKTRKRVASEYFQWPKYKPTAADKKAKSDLGKCPIKGNKGELIESVHKEHSNGWSSDSSWFATEHVFEKQIIGEFFNYIKEKIPGSSCKWLLETVQNADLYYWGQDEGKYTISGRMYDASNNWVNPAGVTGGKNFEPGYIEKGTLIKSMGAMIGGTTRRDLMTLLETDLNSVKGRIFKKHDVYVKGLLQAHGDKKCLRNPALLTMTGNPDPKTVLNDRINLIKQPVVVYKYLLSANVWERFAKTSNNIYNLLEQFDEARDFLRDNKNPAYAAKITEMRDNGSRIRGFSAEWQKGPAATYSFAEEYKKFLLQYMKAVIVKTDSFLTNAPKWMEEFYNGDPLYTAAIKTKLDKETTAYGSNELWKILEPKLQESCFEKPWQTGV